MDGSAHTHRRVVIGDPDLARRQEIRAVAERLGCSVAEASTGEETLALARRRTPALVMLSLELEDPSGYEVCRDLREELGNAVPIAFVSASRGKQSDEVAALLLGADDYLIGTPAADQFRARVGRLLIRSNGAHPASTLTPREGEVLTLLVEGRRTSEISTDLCITQKTTATHIERILAKLGAHSQAQAVAFAVRDRLVDAAA